MLPSSFNRKLDGFITSELNIVKMLTEKRYCGFFTVYREENIIPFGLGVRKNFPLYENLTNAVTTLRDYEVTERSTSKWVFKADCAPQSMNKQFDWTYFTGMLVFFGYVHVFCFVVLILENIYVCCVRKVRGTNKTTQRRP